MSEFHSHLSRIPGEGMKRNYKRGKKMIRVCIYHYDMGVFRRKWIQSVTSDELAKLQESNYRRVIILPENDWYGETLPSILQ